MEQHYLVAEHFCCGSILCIAEFLYFEGTDFCDWKKRLLVFSLWYLLYEQKFFGRMAFGVCGVVRIAVTGQLRERKRLKNVSFFNDKI